MDMILRYVSSHELEPLSSGEKIPPAVIHDESIWSYAALKSFFNLSNIKLSFLATFKKREE